MHVCIEAITVGYPCCLVDDFKHAGRGFVAKAGGVASLADGLLDVGVAGSIVVEDILAFGIKHLNDYLIPFLDKVSSHFR